ncbi:hypothetical protein DERF_006012 [Dermatophagoides farinae]|uniref:Uncharacterized protein n=1 Tax=Dermatophagoides farinae TaxID=6954 RepID=A0A922L7R2_DERFA|nr:hypothetical protein DERF_006012 [Dermatophagoides farinae]
MKMCIDNNIIILHNISSILFKKYFISIQGQLSNGNQVRVEFTKSNIFKNQLLIGFWFNNDITDFFRFNCFTTSCFKLNFLKFRINKIFIINCDSTASNLAVKVSSQTRSGPDVYLQDPYMTKLRIQFCSVRLFPIYLTRTSNGWYRDNFHMIDIENHQVEFHFQEIYYSHRIEMQILQLIAIF